MLGETKRKLSSYIKLIHSLQLLNSESHHSETHLGNVLQSQGIFISVAKGVQAKKEELKAAFGTEDVEAVTKMVHPFIPKHSYNPKTKTKD